ncbi:MAG: discoidin domain-containing protein, partial [Thermoguttaceae bacterium]
MSNSRILIIVFIVFAVSAILLLQPNFLAGVLQGNTNTQHADSADLPSDLTNSASVSDDSPASFSGHSLDPCRRNIITFADQKARTVRLVFHGRIDGQSLGLDEFEIYGPEVVDRNIALKQYGAKVRASSSLTTPPHNAGAELVQDGVFGNSSTWIAAENDENPWIEITFPRVSNVSMVAFSRDLTGKYNDRFPQAVEVQICPWDGQNFTTVTQANLSVSSAPTNLVSWDLPPVPVVFAQTQVPAAPDIRTGKSNTLSAISIPDTWPLDELGSENLSLNKNAKACTSSELHGYDIHKTSNLIDGIHGNSASWVAVNEPAWAQVDLGDEYWIYKVAFGSDSSARYNDRAATNFDILTASDYDSQSGKATWKKVWTSGDDHSPALTRSEFFFEPVKARYVRVDISRASSGGVRIDELEIYGTPQPLSEEKVALIADKIKPVLQSVDSENNENGKMVSTLVDENLFNKSWESAVALEEMAWLKAYGRGDYHSGVVNVPWYPENCKYPSPVPHDITTLVRSTQTPLLTGKYDPKQWSDASSGTVRIAQRSTLKEGAWCECRVNVKLVGDSLYGTIFTNRLLTEYLAVLRTDGAVGILRIQPVRNEDGSLTKESKLVFQTVDSSANITTQPIEHTISDDFRRFEFCIPEKFVQGVENGLMVSTGFGGNFTPASGHPIFFLPQPVAISQVGTVSSGEFVLNLTNTSPEQQRITGRARPVKQENYSRWIDDDFVRYNIGERGEFFDPLTDGLETVLENGVTLSPGESKEVRLPAFAGPLGKELEIALKIESLDNTLDKNKPQEQTQAQTQTGKYNFARINLLEYDPVGRTLVMTNRMLSQPDGPKNESLRAAYKQLCEEHELLVAAGPKDYITNNKVFSDARELFARARTLKRETLFSMPHLEEMGKILFEKRYPLHPSHNYSDCVDNEWRTGGGIYMLDIPRIDGVYRPEKATLQELYKTSGMVRHGAPNFDLSKIYFTERLSMKDFWHIFEMNPDGSGQRQLTSGPFNDLYPTPLPDGDLAMISSRCKLKFLCWIPQALTLHRMDTNGENIRRLSFANLTEFAPSVTNDGRILWTRSEYLDKGADYGHTLWYTTPEGTSPELTFGNTIAHPQGYANGREVPGVNQVCSTLISHFGDLNGPIALLDINKGRFNQNAIHSITPEVPWPGTWISYETFREAFPISTNF